MYVIFLYVCDIINKYNRLLPTEYINVQEELV